MTDTQVIDDALWEAVSERLSEHLRAGREHLLTEDVMRFAAVLELEERGIAPSRMIPEYQAPGVGGKLDLVIDDPPTAAIEFKFPRDSRTGFSPDTMTLGELLKDFYRLGHLGLPESWVVQMINDRVRRFLDNRPEFRWSWVRGQQFALPQGLLARLPRTAQAVFTTARWMTDEGVSAMCMGSFTLKGWTLATYRIS
jgi:hypothetical protein